MSEWQPIETAPKDGEWILLFGGNTDDDDEDFRHVVAMYSDYLNGGVCEPRWVFACFDGGYLGDYKNPTHWMPLPKPPTGDL